MFPVVAIYEYVIHQIPAGEETTMPFINIKIAGPTLTPQHTHRLQQQVTSLMAGVLRKPVPVIRAAD